VGAPPAARTRSGSRCGSARGKGGGGEPLDRARSGEGRHGALIGRGQLLAESGGRGRSASADMTGSTRQPLLSIYVGTASTAVTAKRPVASRVETWATWAPRTS
jgi:hypothetical protein